MKILFVGDLHIKTDNFPDIEKLESFVLAKIEEHSVDTVLLAGDVLHTHERLHTLSLNRSLNFIKNLAEHAPNVVVLVGNHDMINNQQFLNDNHWMTVLKDKWSNVHIVDAPYTEGRIFYSPYVFPGKFYDTFAMINKTPKDFDLIFAHQEFKGCKMGAIVSDSGDEWKADYPLVISGHIHDYQKPQPNVFYPGTPIQHAYGDSGDNIVVLVDYNESTGFVDLLEIPTGLCNKKNIYVDLTKVKMLQQVEQSTRVVVQCTKEELEVYKKTKHYEELNKKCKLVLKVKPEANVNVVIGATNLTFEEILLQHLSKEQNEYILQDYKEIFSA